MDSILLKYNAIVEYGNYRFSFGKELHGTEIQEVFVSRETEIILRRRREQDKIFLNQHYKKLRRYFIDQKIPIDQRKNAVIIEQNGEIIAIAGIVTSNLSKSQKNDIMYNKLYIQNLDR
ncbi:tRNA(Ile)-lysidine synthase [Streptococcus sp. BCA20]|nr:tRNA(Ile)-lysidine synthase [Streptococcus sp. BCA20]